MLQDQNITELKWHSGQNVGWTYNACRNVAWSFCGWMYHQGTAHYHGGMNAVSKAWQIFLWLVNCLSGMGATLITSPTSWPWIYRYSILSPCVLDVLPYLWHAHEEAASEVGGLCRESWVEVLLVVDGPMVRYHGEAVRHYVLTLMHIVS